MYILGLLTETKNGDQYVLIMTDRYTKSTGAIPMATTTATKAAMSIFDSWIIPYGIPSDLLTDNEPQFV